jgi:Amt family ammonium transporter
MLHRIKLPTLLGAAGLLTLAGPAFAQDAAPTIDSGDTAWMLTSTALVLLMTVPGLALFYGGMVRKKNVLATVMQSFAITCLMSVIWMVVGYSLAFTDGGGVNAYVGGLSRFFLAGMGVDAVSGTIPESVFMMFQMTFAIITPALIAGAFADRMKFSAMLWFMGLWSIIVYSPIAHWVWGGGFLAQGTLTGGAAVLDFAGGTVVHINAGIAGGVLALIIGRRKGFGKEPMKPHNLTLTMAGAGLLWFGWYGFNVGSVVLAGDTAEKSTAQFMSETGFTFMNTTLATCAAMLAWLAMERILHGKATSLGAASGIVAGLVAITPSCGAVNLVGAIAIGAVAGALCAWAVSLKYRFDLDDSLDVVGVHLVGGLVGTILIGFLSTAAAPGGIDGLFYGGGLSSLGNQTGAASRPTTPGSSGAASGPARRSRARHPPRRWKEPTDEAGHRDHQAPPARPGQGGPRGLRDQRHDHQRGVRVRAPARSQRGLPRCRVHRGLRAEGPPGGPHRRCGLRPRRRRHPQVRADRPDRRRQGLGHRGRGRREGAYRRARRRGHLRRGPARHTIGMPQPPVRVRPLHHRRARTGCQAGRQVGQSPG